MAPVKKQAAGASDSDAVFYYCLESFGNSDTGITHSSVDCLDAVHGRGQWGCKIGLEKSFVCGPFNNQKQINSPKFRFL